MGHADLLAAMVRALPIAAVVVDTAGVILASNAFAEHTFGCPLGGAVLRFDHPGALDRIPLVQNAVREALLRPAPADVETVDIAGVATLCRLRVIQTDELTGLLLTAEERAGGSSLASQVRVLENELDESRRDMDTVNAELKSANEELHASNAELQGRVEELRDAVEVNRHKDDFLAMLAHELRNPLAPILSAMQVIRRHQDNAEVVQRAREIVERQVRHQARLLDDLLDVSRITRGRIQLRKASVELAAAVGAAVETARPIIHTRRHTLNVVTGPEPVRLEADATRLTQVIAILLDNAAKYTNPGGTITLHAGREGDEAVVRVRDTGIGIPADMQGSVFELFTQVDPSIARSLGGLGIGLTLMKSLVDLHGGRVELRSEGAGRGTEFVVRLPLGDTAHAAAPAPTGRSGRRVLIIEDNADAREMLRMSLALDGHRVDVAEDGPRGVDVALARAPEVVLIDLGLPGLDGYEVARRIRETLGEAVTLVALTGYGQAEDRRRTREAGFDAHFVKPVDPETLSRALNEGFPAAA